MNHGEKLVFLTFIKCTFITAEGKGMSWNIIGTWAIGCVKKPLGTKFTKDMHKKGNPKDET